MIDKNFVKEQSTRAAFSFILTRERIKIDFIERDAIKTLYSSLHQLTTNRIGENKMVIVDVIIQER